MNYIIGGAQVIDSTGFRGLGEWPSEINFALVLMFDFEAIARKGCLWPCVGFSGF